MGVREQTQQTFLNEWQRNGLFIRLPPSRHRVWGLRLLDRLVRHRPQTLLRLCHSILGFWRRRQGCSRE